MVQLTFAGMELAMEAIQKAEETIKDYLFMTKEIVRLRGMLEDAGEGTVVAYSDPNAGIRAYGKNSDKTGGEVVRRDRHWQRLNRLQKRVAQVEAFLDGLTNDKEIAMMELLLEGEYVKSIATEMGISRQRAHEIKNLLVRKLAWVLFEKDQISLDSVRLDTAVA